MRPLGFIVKRMLFLIPIAIGVVTMTFLLANVIPSDPVRAAVGPQASMETVEKVKKDFGLDKPLYEQYIIYFEQLLKGNLGKSLTTRRNVRDDLADKIPASIELGVFSMILGLIPGIILGVVAAVNVNKAPDHVARVSSVAAVSMPSFWMGLLLQLVLASALSWLPLSNRIDAGITLEHITGLFIVDSILTGNAEALRSSLEHILLPAVTLSLPLWAIVARMTRSSMVNVLQQDYIMNARVAAGLPERLVLYKYALKNALIATTSQIGLMFGSFLGGAAIVETIFDWPGLGLYVVRAALAQDLRPILGTTLVISFIFVLINTLTDLTYTILDPRIRNP